LIAKPWARSKISREFNDLAALNNTRGGVSETDANELMVMPARQLSCDAVATATPVANNPNASRKSRAENMSCTPVSCCGWMLGVLQSPEY